MTRNLKLKSAGNVFLLKKTPENYYSYFCILLFSFFINSIAHCNPALFTTTFEKKGSFTFVMYVVCSS
jgi:hypothetical protein